MEHLHDGSQGTDATIATGVRAASLCPSLTCARDGRGWSGLAQQSPREYLDSGTVQRPLGPVMVMVLPRDYTC